MLNLAYFKSNFCDKFKILIVAYLF